MKKVMLLICLVAALAMAQAPKQGTPKVVPVAEEPSHHLVLENEYVRVFQVEVPPHSETKYHQHDRDYIFVTLGDSLVESTRLNEKPVKLELKDGETRFTKGGFAHKALNLSDKPFKNVTVELKKPISADKVVCGIGAGKPACGVYSGGSKEKENQFENRTILSARAVKVIHRSTSGDNASFEFNNETNHLIIVLSGSMASPDRNFEYATNPIKRGEILWIRKEDLATESWRWNGQTNFECIDFEFE